MPFPWSRLRPAPRQRAGMGQPVTGGTGSPNTGRQSPGEWVPLCPWHPHCPGRVGKAPTHPDPPRESGPWGDLRGCFKQRSLPSPAQLLRVLLAPHHGHGPKAGSWG